MTKDSFSFGGLNSVDAWGIRVRSADVLSPEKRSRKTVIPNRSGAYDYGANAYDERLIRLDCDLLTGSPFTKSQLREVAYALSGKKQLRLSTEPSKYYVAELYTSPEVLVQGGQRLYTFTLEFVCDPFAYGDPVEIPISSGRNVLDYVGTAPNGFRLTLANNSGRAVSGLRVSVVYRKN